MNKKMSIVHWYVDDNDEKRNPARPVIKRESALPAQSTSAKKAWPNDTWSQIKEWLAILPILIAIVLLICGFVWGVTYTTQKEYHTEAHILNGTVHSDTENEVILPVYDYKGDYIKREK